MEIAAIEQIHMPHMDASPLEAAMVDRYGPREIRRWPKPD